LYEYWIRRATFTVDIFLISSIFALLYFVKISPIFVTLAFLYININKIKIILNLVTFRQKSANFVYRIVANASPSRFEAHVGLFRLLMKGIFDPYVL
jgi:hypothetical protein